MSFYQKEDFKGRIADIINLSNEQSTGVVEMISVLPGNIKAYLSGKTSEKMEINNENTRNKKLDFSDLLDT